MTTRSRWSVRFTPMGQKNFERLDKPIQKRIQKFLKERVDILWCRPCLDRLSEAEGKR